MCTHTYTTHRDYYAHTREIMLLSVHACAQKYGIKHAYFFTSQFSKTPHEICTKMSELQLSVIIINKKLKAILSYF